MPAPISSSTRYRFFFFFNDTATTETYTSIDTLSLHDALPISRIPSHWAIRLTPTSWRACGRSEEHTSELQSPIDISYAVFCLKKKKRTLRPVAAPRLAHHGRPVARSRER